MKLRATTLVLVTCLSTYGCARRLDVTPEALAMVDEVKDPRERFHVYVDHRVVLLYRVADRQADVAVHSKITVDSDEPPLKRVIRRRTRGEIIHREELNGAPVLWVSFEASCNAVDCAFAFVETKAELYQLTRVPESSGYDPPEVYCGTKARLHRLRPGKATSLNEVNDVFLRRRLIGKIDAITLKFRLRKRVGPPTERDPYGGR